MKFGETDYEIKIWNGEKLNKYVVIDTETEVVPFIHTPRCVTIQAFDGGKDVFYVPLEKAKQFFELHKLHHLIMHNAPFDMDVLSKLMDDKGFMYSRYDANLVRDTGVLYKLLHLAQHGFVPFKYNLKLLTEKYLGVVIEKDERRENFAQFLGKDIGDIPQEYLEYGAGDVIATFFVYQTLMGLISNHDRMGTLLSHDIQVKGEIALQHIYKNGIGFDLLKRDEWLKDVDYKMGIEADILASWGWVRGLKGINDKYEQIIKLLGLEDKLPKTKDGKISSASDDLKHFRLKFPFIDAYLKYQELEKASSFVRNIESSRVHPRYSSIMNTGRTSCSKPNIQQLPRVGGVREMFKPVSEDNVFIDIDYSSLELATLAQVNYTKFGESKMGDLINGGKCLHYYTASSVYNKPEAQITKDERQFAKIPNFGFGANMSPSTFVSYCAGMGVDIDEKRSKEVKEAWVETYPEMKRFFNIGNERNVYTLTGRKRANCSYTAYLNTQFQGLAADGFKLALYNVDKAGFRIAAQVHDQIVVEVKREDAERLMPKIQTIMEDSMSLVVPEVDIGTEGQIIERFTK